MSGLPMVTVQFVFASPLVAELRSEPESENTWRGSAGSEDHHAHDGETEKGNGNLCEELD